MKKIQILASAFTLAVLFSCTSNAQQTSTPPAVSPMPMKPEMTEIWEPEVAVVTPGKTSTDAPSDAIVLFDGKDLSQWVSVKDGSPAKWAVIDGRMEVVPGTGDIKTKLKFGDCQIHIEFSAPDLVEGSSQGRGNSGIFLQDRYELQILDSYQNRTYRNGQAGSIYKDAAPLVNAMRGPLEWNTYDITAKGTNIRVVLNGVETLNIDDGKLPKGVITLQRSAGVVKYRKVMIRAL